MAFNNWDLDYQIVHSVLHYVTYFVFGKVTTFAT